MGYARRLWKSLAWQGLIKQASGLYSFTWCIDSWTKWMTSCRWHSEVHFLERKLSYIDLVSLKFVLRALFGSFNGMMLNKILSWFKFHWNLSLVALFAFFQITAWHWTVGKPLPKSMMAQVCKYYFVQGKHIWEMLSAKCLPISHGLKRVKKAPGWKNILKKQNKTK